MAKVNTTARPKATIEPGSNPVIYNVSCALANTEYSQALNTNAKKILIRVRGLAKLQLAFTFGDSGTDYISLPMGCSFTEEAILFNGGVYFQLNKPNQVVEILEWY